MDLVNLLNLNLANIEAVISNTLATIAEKQLAVRSTKKIFSIFCAYYVLNSLPTSQNPYYQDKLRKAKQYSVKQKVTLITSKHQYFRLNWRNILFNNLLKYCALSVAQKYINQKVLESLSHEGSVVKTRNESINHSNFSILLDIVFPQLNVFSKNYTLELWSVAKTYFVLSLP